MLKCQLSHRGARHDNHLNENTAHFQIIYPVRELNVTGAAYGINESYFLTSAHMNNCWEDVGLLAFGRLPDKKTATILTLERFYGRGGGLFDCSTSTSVGAYLTLITILDSPWEKKKPFNKPPSLFQLTDPLTNNRAICMGAVSLAYFEGILQVLHMICRHQGAAFNMHESPGNSRKGGMSDFCQIESYF